MRLRLSMAFVLLTVLSAPPVSAAVRLCKGEVASGLVRGESELEARKRALALWREKALAFGEEFSSWRLANGKLFTCLQHPLGGFGCLAKGAPCTIEQAPDRRENREKRFEL